MINGELIVDNFAGGGGASTGIEIATGYNVDIEINHDPEAIRMHMTNHPNTKHYCEDVCSMPANSGGAGQRKSPGTMRCRKKSNMQREKNECRRKWTVQVCMR